MNDGDIESTQYELEHTEPDYSQDDLNAYEDGYWYEEHENERDEPELIETSFSEEIYITRVHKMLMATVVRVYGNRYYGQDWGEAYFWDDTHTGQITEIFKKRAALAVRQYAKDLQDGQTLGPIGLYDVFADEDEDHEPASND